MTKTRVTSTRFGVFHSREAADRAIAELKAAGYTSDQIGLVYRNAGGSTTKLDGAGVPDTNAPEGAALGAAAGAVGGAAVGAGILAGVIPVIGPVLALGTLGTVLVNAAGGAAIAGVAGALIGWGIPEEDAKYYESEVSAGRYPGNGGRRRPRKRRLRGVHPSRRVRPGERTAGVRSARVTGTRAGPSRLVCVPPSVRAGLLNAHGRAPPGGGVAEDAAARVGRCSRLDGAAAVGLRGRCRCGCRRSRFRCC